MGNALPVSMSAAVKLSQAPNLRDEYYGQCNILKRPEDFSQVVHHQRHGGFAPILKTLMPEGIAMGSTTQEVLDRMGKPNFVLSNDRNVNGHQVIFFRKDLSPFMVSLQFHMYRGRLVYAQSRFIDSEDARGTMHEVLLAIIRRNTGAEKGEFAYQDGDGNRLWVDQSEQLVLHYLSGDNALKGLFPKPQKYRYQRPAKRSHLQWLRDSA